MSVAVRAGAPARDLDAPTPVVDALLFASVFTITFANVRWAFGNADVNVSDIAATLFVLAFVLMRIDRRDGAFPRTAAVLLGFFALFTLVYLAGFFNLETMLDRELYAKGIVKFTIHFALLVCAVIHLARRGEDFYWRTLAWFMAGFAANAVYGLVEFATAELTGANLDQILLSPIGSYKKGGIGFLGAVQGESVYRANAMTLDPNHLGVMLVVPLMVLLPVYLRLRAGHRLRGPLAVTLALLAVTEVATLSRSGMLGVAVGLIVLAIPYWRSFLTARFLAPLALVVLALGIVVAQRTDFFEQVLRSRTNPSGPAVQVHLELYQLLAPVIDQHPLFGLGLNTFADYFEFITGKSNWGPHSYFVAVLTETGIIGGMLFVVYMGYLVSRLRLIHRVGRALDRVRGDEVLRVQPLAWGLTAALAGTLAANAFYLTMQMYYFFVLAMLIAAAPVVFAGRTQAPRPAGMSGKPG